MSYDMCSYIATISIKDCPYAILISLLTGPIDPPTNVKAMVITSRSIEITWSHSSSSDVTGYSISYTTTASYTSGGRVTVNGGSTTSGTLTNLEEDTLYTIIVQATTSDNRMSANNNKVSVRTYTDGK